MGNDWEPHETASPSREIAIPSPLKVAVSMAQCCPALPFSPIEHLCLARKIHRATSPLFVLIASLHYAKR